jgi:hypothetical protein
MTVWLQVRVLPGPPRCALAGYAWRSHAGTVRAKRVRRSLSEANAKTDWNWLGEGGPCAASYCTRARRDEACPA